VKLINPISGRLDVSMTRYHPPPYQQWLGSLCLGKESAMRPKFMW
jgi:hypothetical protein